MTAGLADDAPGTAIVGRGPPGGRIRHGDHGSRHVSPLIGRTVREAGIGPSTGSIASPRDSAATESLTGPVKAECVRARTPGHHHRVGHDGHSDLLDDLGAAPFREVDAVVDNRSHALPLALP